MKNIILFIGILSSTIMLGQELDKNAHIKYEGVVNVDGVSKDELFNRAKLWFAKEFKSANAVIQLDNKDDGTIIGKGRFAYDSNISQGFEATQGGISFTVSIFVKDGRYKYEFVDFRHDPNDPKAKDMIGYLTNNPVYPVENANYFKFKTKLWIDMKKQTDENMAVALQKLAEEMKSTQETKKSDW